MSGASEQVNGRPCGLVLQSVYLVVLAHSAIGQMRRNGCSARGKLVYLPPKRRVSPVKSHEKQAKKPCDKKEESLGGKHIEARETNKKQSCGLVDKSQKSREQKDS